MSTDTIIAQDNAGFESGVSTIDALCQSGMLRVIDAKDEDARPPVSVYALPDAVEMLKTLDVASYKMSKTTIDEKNKTHELGEYVYLVDAGNYNHDEHVYMSGIGKLVGGTSHLREAVANAERVPEKSKARDIRDFKTESKPVFTGHDENSPVRGRAQSIKDAKEQNNCSAR